ncbi:MAG TPA: YfhO family protein [Bryobacteraceae bacterium]|nr:YfhO family protein [Bryobacteraceae bacterium]
MRRLGSKLAIPALLAIIAIGFNWKLLLPGQYTWIESPDNLNQVVPWLQVQATEWHGGHFPLWDPFMCAGQPLIGQVQPGSLNPLNWILFSMPFRDGLLAMAALHWYWVAIQFLGLLFAYLLCRDLKLSRAASILGGCAFGLGGFVGSIGWPQKMMSGILLPLILMFFLRVLRGEKPLANAATSGTLLGASFLSGHHNLPVFFALAMGGLWVYHFVTLGRAGWRKAIPPAAAFSVCCLLIAAAQFLPSYELGKLSLRWSGATHPLEWNEKVEYSVHDQYSLYPTALLGIIVRAFDHGAAIFTGFVVLTLGLLGAVARWQERMVRVLAAVSLSGLLFALGSRDLFHGILYALVPDLDKARAPNVAVAIFQLGIIALAAYGLDSFRSAHASDSAKRLSIRMLSLLALFFFGSVIVMNTVRPQQGEEYKVLAEAAIVALLLAGILQAWSHSRLSNQSAAVLLILLLLFELNNVTNYGLQPVDSASGVQKMKQDRELAGFLKLMRPPVRVEVDEQEIPYNFGDRFGVQTINGNHPAALKSFATVMGDAHSKPLLAVNYYIGKEPKRPGQIDVFAGQRGLKVFSDPQAFPYARLVHNAAGLPNEAAVVAAVQDSKTDLRTTVVVEGAPPPIEACDGGTTEVSRYRYTSVIIRTDSPCRAMVVLADVWYPGWKATVDGKPAKLWKAYNVVRGVVVDAGQHEVLMVYRPPSVFIGAALGVLGILLCLMLRRWPGKQGWRGIHFSHHLHPAPRRPNV